MAAADSSGPTPRRLLFGSVAEDYERYRLGYPEELADLIWAYAGRPVRTALEVGAGTGKATRLVAGRGAAVTALEPDPDMFAVLTRTTAELPVTAVCTGFEHFEEFDTDERFDLLFAAAAWHWTDPDTRYRRAARLLAPGGVFACFGRPADLADPDLAARVDELERRFGPDAPASTWTDHPVGEMSWPGQEMQDVEILHDVEEHDLPGDCTVAADEYVGRLATVSAYLMLSESARSEALAEIRAVLPDRVRLDTSVRVHLARVGAPDIP